MPLPLRTATALRWRPTALSGALTDLVRIRQDGEVCLAMLANGFECGFSMCWPPASRLMLDFFEGAWAATSGVASERLGEAFEAARKQFDAQAAALIEPDADFPDDLPAAELLVVAVEGHRAHAAWIGGDVAWLVRALAVVAETRPHTLREQYKREYSGEGAVFDQVPNVLVRYIGPGAAEHDPPSTACFDVAAGDTLMLLSRAATSNASAAAGHVALAAASHVSPAALAERLAELAYVESDAFYAAVAVLRFDTIDVGTEIDRLIDGYEPDPRHGAWVGDWARAQRALPVIFDMGGVFAMRRDGSVISAAWDEPETSTREETSAATHLAAAIGASQKYPALRPLAPARPPSAQACPHCKQFTPVGDGCPMCWYLGWQLPELPAWFHAPLGAVRSEVAEACATASPRSWWRRLFGKRG